MLRGALATVVLAKLALKVFRRPVSTDSESQVPRQSLETLRFLFDKRLALFNTRREHEWRVTFGAMATIGAVDAGLLTQELQLSVYGILIWVFVIAVLFVAVWFYQLGVQRRNRVDRIVMDEICQRMCDLEDIPATSPIRFHMDIAEAEHASRRLPLFNESYLWAFKWQMVVLGTGCVLSAGLPLVMKGQFIEAEPAVAAQAVEKVGEVAAAQP